MRSKWPHFHETLTVRRIFHFMKILRWQNDNSISRIFFQVNLLSWELWIIRNLQITWKGDDCGIFRLFMINFEFWILTFFLNIWILLLSTLLKLLLAKNLIIIQSILWKSPNFWLPKTYASGSTVWVVCLS